MTISVIIGSTRQGRFSEKAGGAAARALAPKHSKKVFSWGVV